MSGHSKWAGIKHKKAIIDAKRGKVFTKIVREISISARVGGGNPEHNARLRKAIDLAKEANMPVDNVKKAVSAVPENCRVLFMKNLLMKATGPAAWP